MFKLDNVVTIPHIAAYSIEAVLKIDLMNAKDMVKFFKGRKPQHIANPEVLEKIRLK